MLAMEPQMMPPLRTITRTPNTGKPGRALTQFDADEIAREMGVPWSQIRSPYALKITAPIPAGNHYHLHKREIIEVLLGTVRVILEDPKTKERQEVTLCDDPAMGDPQAVVVPLGIAHVVVPLTIPCVTVTWATEPARQPEDDIEYIIVPKGATPTHH